MSDKINEFVQLDPDLEMDRSPAIKRKEIIAYAEPAETPATITTHEKKEDPNIEKDLEYARNNLYSMMDVGRDALDSLAQLASASDNPRAYESISQLIQTLTNTTKELIGLQKAKKDIRKEEVKKEETNITNNNLILTTDEAIKKILGK